MEKEKVSKKCVACKCKDKCRAPELAKEAPKEDKVYADDYMRKNAIIDEHSDDFIM
jgi:hypothetical protein